MSLCSFFVCNTVGSLFTQVTGVTEARGRRTLTSFVRSKKFRTFPSITAFRTLTTASCACTSASLVLRGPLRWQAAATARRMTRSWERGRPRQRRARRRRQQRGACRARCPCASACSSAGAAEERAREVLLLASTHTPKSVFFCMVGRVVFRRRAMTRGD